MEIILSAFVGIGLSAACGFRVFVPFLIASIASLSGHINLSSGFEWIGTYPALVTFAIASIIEVGGYFIPLIDHLLDTIATPAAVIAGILLTASFVSGLSPFLGWTLAIIAGGGVAGTVQVGTVTVRAISTGTTAGLANPVVSTIESGGSVVLSIIAITFPVAAIIMVAVLIYIALKKILKKKHIKMVK